MFWTSKLVPYPFVHNPSSSDSFHTFSNSHSIVVMLIMMPMVSLENSLNFCETILFTIVESMVEMVKCVGCPS